MKSTIFAAGFFAVVRLLPLLAAAVPTEWTVRIGPRSASYQAERRHGDALDLRATLTYNGQPLAYTGPARLYAQTNGMGSAWWDLAPCTVVSNTLQATWLPSFDTGADVVDLFLGGPSNYQAAARIRFLPSPGSTPNALPLPVPVLDFSTVIVTNAPFALSSDVDYSTSNTQLVATIEAKAPAPGNYAAVSNSAMNARSITDLGVRGAPQGEGSWFTANGRKLVWYGEYGYAEWGDGQLLIRPNGNIYTMSGAEDVDFALSDNFSQVVHYDGIDYIVVGYTNTLAQVSQIPDTDTIVQDVVRTSTNYTDSALTNYATKSAIDEGWWSEWEPDRHPSSYELEIVEWEDNLSTFMVTVIYDGNTYIGEAQADGGRYNATVLTFTYAGRQGRVVRHRVAAPVPTKPSDIGAQDALPYPTNAIPYSAITGAPAPPSVFYDTAGGTAAASGATLTYQAASNAVGSVALLAGTNVLHITAPAAIAGRVRDFGLTVTTEDAATITLDSSVSWHFDAASTNLAAGSWNRIYCTESPSGVFSLQLWTPDSAQEATP